MARAWRGVLAAVLGALAGFASGELELEVGLLPSPTLRSSLVLRGEAAGLSLASTSIAYLDTWVWQEFSARGAIGPLSLEGVILFGPSTLDFVYGEAVLGLSLAGVDVTLYAAQLSDAVLGGPSAGAALEMEVGLWGMGARAITEFGASPTGIEIFHAPTGISREYTTDPRPGGEGFTAQRLYLTGMPPPCPGCPSLDLELSFTKDDGFAYLKISAEELFTWCCPRVAFDLEVEFRVQTKAVAISPRITVGPACLVPHLEPEWDPFVLGGISVAALELSCELDGARLRSVTILKRCCWAISAPEFGSRVVRCFVADREGIEYYPEYWELLSVEVWGPACCGGEWRATFNAYFGDTGALLGWGMGYLELWVPLAAGWELGGRMQAAPGGVEELSLTVGFSW
jgi:hypothetical protein